MEKDLQVDDILREYAGASLLEKGAQKVVFSYDHDSYGPVVIKIGGYESRQELERIKREVDILRSIRSNSYPRNFEFRILEGKRFLIVEQRMVGEPLSDHITEFSSAVHATFLIECLVSCLSELWAMGIVHRDLKPMNIIVGPDNQPRIIDLGIARILDGRSLTFSLWIPGPCTPAYASPEQLLNEKRLINHRADQFALGIIFAQLLLGGRHPFAPEIVGRGDSIPDNILDDCWAKREFADSRFIPVRPILDRMLAHQAYQRYRKPADLQRDLQIAHRSLKNG